MRIIVVLIGKPGSDIEVKIQELVEINYPQPILLEKVSIQDIIVEFKRKLIELDPNLSLSLLKQFYLLEFETKTQDKLQLKLESIEGYEPNVFRDENTKKGCALLLNDPEFIETGILEKFRQQIAQQINTEIDNISQSLTERDNFEALKRYAGSQGTVLLEIIYNKQPLNLKVLFDVVPDESTADYYTASISPRSNASLSGDEGEIQKSLATFYNQLQEEYHGCITGGHLFSELNNFLALHDCQIIELNNVCKMIVSVPDGDKQDKGQILSTLAKSLKEKYSVKAMPDIDTCSLVFPLPATLSLEQVQQEFEFKKTSQELLQKLSAKDKVQDWKFQEQASVHAAVSPIFKDQEISFGISKNISNKQTPLNLTIKFILKPGKTDICPSCERKYQDASYIAWLRTAEKMVGGPLKLTPETAERLRSSLEKGLRELKKTDAHAIIGQTAIHDWTVEIIKEFYRERAQQNPPDNIPLLGKTYIMEPYFCEVGIYAQCEICEAVQADYCLLQRYQKVAQTSLPLSFMGKVWLERYKSKEKPTGIPQEIIKSQGFEKYVYTETNYQINRILRGLKSQLEDERKKSQAPVKTSPVKTNQSTVLQQEGPNSKVMQFILENWDIFQKYYIEEMLKRCKTQDPGNIEQSTVFNQPILKILNASDEDIKTAKFYFHALKQQLPEHPVLKKEKIDTVSDLYNYYCSTTADPDRPVYDTIISIVAGQIGLVMDKDMHVPLLNPGEVLRIPYKRIQFGVGQRRGTTNKYPTIITVFQSSVPELYPFPAPEEWVLPSDTPDEHELQQIFSQTYADKFILHLVKPPQSLFDAMSGLVPVQKIIPVEKMQLWLPKILGQEVAKLQRQSKETGLSQEIITKAQISLNQTVAEKLRELMKKVDCWQIVVNHMLICPDIFTEALIAKLNGLPQVERQAYLLEISEKKRPGGLVELLAFSRSFRITICLYSLKGKLFEIKEPELSPYAPIGDPVHLLYVGNGNYHIMRPQNMMGEIEVKYKFKEMDYTVKLPRYFTK